MYAIEEEQDHTTIIATASSTFVVQGVPQRDLAHADNVRRALSADAIAELHRAIHAYLALPDTASYPALDVTLSAHSTALTTPSVLRHEAASITRVSGLTTMSISASAALYT